MEYVVFLPFVVPLTALPVGRLAVRHLHPRTATLLLTALAVVLALCSTVCLGLFGVVGTARIPHNPLPDTWADPEVRAAVPWDEVTGFASLAALLVALLACVRTGTRHRTARVAARRAASAVRDGGDVAVLPDPSPYAYALPGRPALVVVSRGMRECLTEREYAAVLAHERAHLAGRHHGLLLVARLAACANPLLRPLVGALAYGAERWADEEAARVVGDRRVTARAVGRAALSSRGRDGSAGLLPAFAAPGPVPRRVAALLAPAPVARWTGALWGPVGWAVLMAGGGVVVSAASSFNAAVTVVGVWMGAGVV
ncbi:MULTISPECIES: M56 family metallopeptidase [Streptomyces]|uniref:M56 family metallopeptidase n=1 Tax=Streptomyces TaxID=1883 RepID=UPI0028858ED3|nr:M56 family metallopeptidase [Streptomyces sp. DSM 41859]MDT0424428.1 M56 family metallopeptidase [Streptomyces sp. DSM 41859]